MSLDPVLSWRAGIAQIKQVPAGADIGYGCTYRTTRPTKLAVVPVGYYDGYDRGLSNTAHVLVRGRRAPVRGRVAMDFLMADVTDVHDAARSAAGGLVEALSSSLGDLASRIQPKQD